jgi:hypothetical protein
MKVETEAPKLAPLPSDVETLIHAPLASDAGEEKSFLTAVFGQYVPKNWFPA